MKFGYARVSTGGQSVAAQVAALRAAGAGKVFREVASGARADRTQLSKAFSRYHPAHPNRADDATTGTPELSRH